VTDAPIVSVARCGWSGHLGADGAQFGHDLVMHGPTSPSTASGIGTLPTNASSIPKTSCDEIGMIFFLAALITF